MKFKMISNFRSAVNLLFSKYMLATNIVSSGLLMGIGDIIQQHLEYYNNEKRTLINYGRLGRMVVIGLVEGPVHHMYYVTFLEKVLPGMDIKTVAKKIFLDQALASPMFIFTFFYGMGTMEGKNVDEMNKEIKKKLLQVYTVDCLIWPPCQFLNFYYLSPKYRVIFINGVTMCYNVFLSYVKHKDNVI